MNSPIIFLFLVFAIGVFGDTDGQNSVSVMEGDSVTLHSGVSEIQSKDTIEWKFAGNRLAKISSGRSSIEEAFGNRLQLDNQTGDLKITNIKTTNSGEYTLKIRSSSGSSDMTFNVNVVSAGVKSVSVMVGDSVTLHTGLTDIQRYDVIRWRFDHQNSPVAEIDKTAGILKTYDGPDERFRHRLHLDNQTGSLTIKNIGTSHSGLYEVDIISTSRRYTIHKSFSVTISDEVKSVSVKEGETVTLQTITEIQNDDLILWMFGDIRLAEINKTEQRFFTSDGPDERFRGRLKLDHKTVSLNITDTKTTDSGDYELKISSSRHIINRRIIVTVTATDINTTYIPPGTSSSNNYSAVPVSGLSPAAVAGIVGVIVGVLLGAAAAAAVVVIYYRHKISGLKSQSEENGQNHKNQDTDDPANEETKLSDP